MVGGTSAITKLFMRSRHRSSLERPPDTRFLARLGVGEQRRRARQRALADKWLAWGAIPREESRLLSPRADELTSAKSRRALAKVCRRYVAEIRDPSWRAYAVNRAPLRRHVSSLSRLGARVGDLDRPVSAHSILLVREVLNGNGPLFNRARAHELGPALNAALRALDDDAGRAP
jgi:hypothetical protein